MVEDFFEALVLFFFITTEIQSDRHFRIEDRTLIDPPLNARGNQIYTALTLAFHGLIFARTIS